MKEVLVAKKRKKGRMYRRKTGMTDVLDTMTVSLPLNHDTIL